MSTNDTSDDALAERHAAAAARSRILARSFAQHPTARPEPFSLEEEANRQAAARTRAYAGKEHADYFPRLKCKTCGGIPWLDDERNVIRDYHDAEKHGMTTGVQQRRDPSAPRDVTRADFDRAARNMRARRATGERDDDE